MAVLKALVLLLVFGAGVGTIAAADVPASLPPDGTWVRYYVVREREGAVEAGAGFKHTVAFVRTVTEKGERCRWIEERIETEHEGQPREHTIKYLISENELLRGESPSEALRAWQKDPSGTVTAVEGDWLMSQRGVVKYFAPGILSKGKRFAGTRTVDHQRGRYECTAALTGEYRYRYSPDNQSTDTHATTYTCWLHEEIPMGVALRSARTTVDYNGRIARVMNEEFRVEEFGTNAKSAIGDHW